MPRPKRTRRVAARRSQALEPASLIDTQLANDDATLTRGRPTTRALRWSLQEQDAVRSANRTHDAALERLVTEDATSASGLGTGDDTMSSIELGRRAAATPVTLRDTTGLDLADDDVFGDLDDSFADGDLPPDCLSIDDSSLMSNHLGPRSRRSSFIGRNDHPIRPSSRGTNTPGISSSFNIGRFRRRAREPSILSTLRKPLYETGGTDKDSEGESGAEPEPDVEPATPASRRRVTRRSLQSNDDPSSSRLRSRKRKNAEARDSDRLNITSPIEPATAPPEDDSDPEPSVLTSSPPSLVVLARPVTPANQVGITAPPASSGSEGGVHIWPDIHVLAKRRRRHFLTTPLRTDALSDVSSPPSLTHSPNYKEEKATRQRGRPAMRRPESPKMTTADLTNLLPKRWQRRMRDSFGGESDAELDGSDLAQNEGHSYVNARSSRTRKGSRLSSRAASVRAGSRAASRVVDEGSILRSKQMTASSRRSARFAKTYHPQSSDKENASGSEEEEQSRFEPLPDNSFGGGSDGGNSESQSSAPADELKRAAKKFKEVDEWELNFEEVTEPPSPQDAR